MALFRLAASRPSVDPAPRQKSLQAIIWTQTSEALGEQEKGSTVNALGSVNYCTLNQNILNQTDEAREVNRVR